MKLEIIMVMEIIDKEFHCGKSPGQFHFRICAGDKYEIIKNFVSGKNVLDIGCTGGDPDAYSNELWVHGYIKRTAKSAKGLDLNKNEVERLNDLGYDIVVGNAENFDLFETFDVIFSGDLIEHLSNPGLFLESARLHMGQESRLILVTPNPYRYGRIMDILLKGYVRNHPDHTCWFDPVTLSQLLNFHNFRVEAIYWTGYTKRVINYLGTSVLDNLSFRGILAQDFVVVAKIKT